MRTGKWTLTARFSLRSSSYAPTSRYDEGWQTEKPTDEGRSLRQDEGWQKVEKLIGLTELIRVYCYKSTKLTIQLNQPFNLIPPFSFSFSRLTFHFFFVPRPSSHLLILTTSIFKASLNPSIPESPNSQFPRFPQSSTFQLWLLSTHIYDDSFPAKRPDALESRLTPLSASICVRPRLIFSPRSGQLLLSVCSQLNNASH